MVSYKDSVPVVSIVRMSPIGCAVAQRQALLPYGNVTIKTEVSRQVLYD